MPKGACSGAEISPHISCVQNYPLNAAQSETVVSYNTLLVDKIDYFFAI